jgi:nucleotide-binding universal stress UspA family protein
MGTKGATGLEEALIGSNAASILHTVNVPVLCIPQKAEILDVKTIVYCSDFKSKKNDRALCRLADFAKIFDAKILVLHIRNKQDDHKDEFEAKFNTCLSNVEHTLHLEESDNIENSINDFVSTHQADLVALLVRKYSFIEGLFHTSITSKVAYHTNVPFLALHETK